MGNTCTQSLSPSPSSSCAESLLQSKALSAPGLPWGAEARRGSQGASRAARQASLSITNSQSLLKLMSIESVMLSSSILGTY